MGRITDWLLGTRATTLEQTNYPGMNRMTGLGLNQWDWLGDWERQLKIEELRKAYLGNPIIRKAISKKSRDLIYEGFQVDSPVDGENIPDNIKDTVESFLKEKQIIRKTHSAIRDSLWSNMNGWIEWICQGNKYPDQPLNGKLLDIAYVKTGYITGYILNKEKTAVEYWKLAVPIKKDGKEYKKIHASRLEPIGLYFEGNNPFSKSIIETARQAIKADNDVTKALGDNLVMFGHPFAVINTPDNTNRKAVDDAFRELAKLKKKELKTGWAGFKDTKFNLLNPTSPNPASTLNHIYTEIAAAAEIPLMFLIGEQKGKLTGSKVELADYYKSIESNQVIYLSPIFHKMFKLLIGDSWKYEIYWNPLYVDEETEIKNKTLLMEKIGELYSKHGVIDVPEARQLLREYDIDIPEDGELDEPDEPIGEELADDGEEGNIGESWEIRRPTASEMEIAKKQRKLGEKALKEGWAR